MKNELFRKSSIERISSPEKLDEYMRVSNPSAWVILLALLCIMIGTFYWGVTGEMPSTTSIDGVITTEEASGDYIVYSCIPRESASALSEGMEVQVSPKNADRSNYGYIKGKIETIATYEFSVDALAQDAADGATTSDIVKIIIKLDKDSDSKNGLAWSNNNGKSVEIKSGLYSTVLVVTKTTRPLDFVLKRVNIG